MLVTLHFHWYLLALCHDSRDLHLCNCLPSLSVRHVACTHKDVKSSVCFAVYFRSHFGPVVVPAAGFGRVLCVCCAWSWVVLVLMACCVGLVPRLRASISQAVSWLVCQTSSTFWPFLCHHPLSRNHFNPFKPTGVKWLHFKVFTAMTFGHSGAQEWVPECPNVMKKGWVSRRVWHWMLW